MLTIFIGTGAIAGLGILASGCAGGEMDLDRKAEPARATEFSPGQKFENKESL